MDLIFKCPHCDQELEVDAAGAGSELACPSCAKTIKVPDPEPANIVSLTSATATGAPKVEKHFVVPQRAVPAEVLIQKPKRPLDLVAKDGDKKLRIKSFKRSDCQEVGHDHFDETVSEFLEKVGQSNIVSISPLTYSYIDSGSRQVMADYGVMIVFRG
jgi:hypothetical protein